MKSGFESRGLTSRLLVFIVAYEAESTLKDVLDRIPREVLESFDLEVLIVDDASYDRTYEIGLEYSIAHPEMPLTVLRNQYNQGYGGNQKIGYAYAAANGFDFVALLHGDGQYAPEALPELLGPLVDETADAVFGSRMLTPGAARAGGMPRYKYVGNKILSRVQNVLLRSDMSEFHSGYRVYRVSTLAELHYELNTNDFHFDTQIILQLMNNGNRIVEVAIPTYYGDEICRVNGVSYAWNVFVSTLANAFHSLGLFQQRRLDPAIAEESPYRSKLGFVSPHSLAVGAVEPGSSVIDLGAGPGDVGRTLLEKGCGVTVVDMVPFPGDTGGIEVHVQDLDDPLTFDVSSRDTILMLDVIEHLADPEDFLDRLRTQFGHEPKTLILSTPNIAFVFQRIALAFGQFNYGRTGILDRTHTRLFTFRTLRHLLRDAGYEIEVMRGVPAPFPLVAGDTVGGWLSRFNELLIRVSKGLFSFQIFVIAKSTPSVTFLLEDALHHDDG